MYLALFFYATKFFSACCLKILSLNQDSFNFFVRSQPPSYYHDTILRLASASKRTCLSLLMM